MRRPLECKSCCPGRCTDAPLLALLPPQQPNLPRHRTRMRAALANLDEGEFTEGHELDRKWRVPKAMIGRRLSQEAAKGLLGKFGLSARRVSSAVTEAVMLALRSS